MLGDLVEGFRAIVFGPSLDERRLTARVTCKYPVSCRTKAGAMVGDVLDLSANGLRLATDRSLRKGEKLKVDPPRGLREAGEAVTGVVRWCRRRGDNSYQVGVSLVPGAKSWVGRALRELGLNPDAPRERRRFIRVSGKLEVELRDDGNPVLTGELLDLSLGGALVRCSSKLSKRAQVRMRVSSLAGLSPLDLVAVVKEVSEPERGGYTLSLQFSRPSEGQQKELGRYLASLIRSARAAR